VHFHGKTAENYIKQNNSIPVGGGLIMNKMALAGQQRLNQDDSMTKVNDKPRKTSFSPEHFQS